MIDGPRGWWVVASAFLSMFTVFGVAYSFGSFFGPMADEFGSDRGGTALFFAITTFAYFALGVVSGHVADRRGPRPVLLFGAGALVIGLLLTARVDSIWLGYLTYGLGVGIGVACGYVPMVAAVGGWFDRGRTTALGVAVAGIGVGTLTVTPLAEVLIDEYGWRRTYELFAAAAAVTLSVAAIGAHRPPIGGADGSSSSLVDVVRTSRPFRVLYVSMVLVSMALFVPFVFLADYVDTEGISGSAGLLVGSIGISSVVGRLGLGRLAGVVPPRRLFDLSLTVMSASFLLWLGLGSSYPGLVVFTVVLGVAYGGFIALSPAVAAEMFGVDGLGGVLGALYTAAGVGGLAGPPLSGVMIDAAGYSTTIVSALVVSAVGVAILRLEPGQTVT